jgi:hypothetical protein
MSCAGCRRVLDRRVPFESQTTKRVIAECWACALRRPWTLGRSSVIALVVGTVLTAINPGDLLLGGSWSSSLLWKIPLTYAMPFIVATLGALGNGMVKDPGTTRRRQSDPRVIRIAKVGGSLR